MDLDEEGRTGLGFWGLGRREWDGRWRKKKRKKKERKRTKEEDGEQEIESLRLDFHVDLLVHLSFANTQKSSLLNSICYSEIKSKRLELLVS